MPIVIQNNKTKKFYATRTNYDYDGYPNGASDTWVSETSQAKNFGSTKKALEVAKKSKKKFDNCSIVTLELTVVKTVPLDFKAMELEELIKKRDELAKQIASIDASMGKIDKLDKTTLAPKSKTEEFAPGRIGHLELE